MPISLFGFVEVARFDDDLESEYAWNLCVDIMPFPLWAEDVCAILFGVAKWETGWPPVASGRGIPPWVSHRGKQAIEEEMAYEGDDKAYGYTYITYEELKQVDWQAYAGADLSELEKPLGWYLLFKTMDTLSECFQAQRLVVWFHW
jgi:hypothetical protein